LRSQLNALAPHRSTVSDGSIGDAAHSARYSDHNPTAAGQVCARDFTHDPAGGLDCGSLADRLVRSGDNRIKYIIWNRRIWEPGVGWKAYSGVNPHTKHLHLSVKAGAVGDSTRQWDLGRTADQGDNDMDANQDRMLREVTAVVTGAAGATYPADGPGLRSRIADVNSRVGAVETKVTSLDSKVGGIDTRLQAVADMCEAILTKLNETEGGTGA
jgi:hypothetical protein